MYSTHQEMDLAPIEMVNIKEEVEEVIIKQENDDYNAMGIIRQDVNKHLFTEEYKVPKKENTTEEWDPLSSKAEGSNIEDAKGIENGIIEGDTGQSEENEDSVGESLQYKINVMKYFIRWRVSFPLVGEQEQKNIFSKNKESVKNTMYELRKINEERKRKSIEDEEYFDSWKVIFPEVDIEEQRIIYAKNGGNIKKTMDELQKLNDSLVPLMGGIEEADCVTYMTGYMLFSAEIKESISKRNPQLSIKEITELVDFEWKSLSETERRTYEQTAHTINLSSKQRELEGGHLDFKSLNKTTNPKSSSETVNKDNSTVQDSPVTARWDEQSFGTRASNNETIVVEKMENDIMDEECGADEVENKDRDKPADRIAAIVDGIVVPEGREGRDQPRSRHGTGDDNYPRVDPGCKRKRDESKWARNVAKSRKAHGQAYKSCKTGKEMPAAQLGPPCAPSCKMLCFSKFDAGAIDKYFKDFWATASHRKQDLIMSRGISNRPVKRRRSKDTTKPEKPQYSYDIHIGDKKIRVCRKAFLSIHGIGDSRLCRVYTSMKTSETGTPAHDARGHHSSANQIDGIVIEALHEYIRTIPCTTTHHSRSSNPRRRYLPVGMTTSKVFAAYVDWMQQHHPILTPVKDSYFRYVYNDQYSILPRLPTLDKCDVCEKAAEQLKKEIKCSPQARMIQRKLDLHKAEAVKRQKHMSRFINKKNKDYKHDPTWKVLAIDLMQTQPLPKLSNQSSFFKKKIWHYISSIFDNDTQKNNYYTWQEYFAKHSGDEIASNLFHYIMNSENCRGIKKFRIFMDNCAGQNKNIYMILMFLYLLHFGRAETIVLEFLLSGHSFMPCDQGFANLDKKFKSNEMISCPAHYTQLIGEVSMATHRAVSQGDIFDWKDLFAFITYQKAKAPILLSKAYRITLSIKHPWKIRIETNKGNELVDLARVTGEQRLLPDMMREELGTTDLKLKYEEGKHIILPAGKATNLKQMQPFLDAPGRRWVNHVLKMQQSAVTPPRLIEDDPYIEVHPDNLNDEDLHDQYDEPLRYLPEQNHPVDDSGNEMDSDDPDDPESPVEPRLSPSSLQYWEDEQVGLSDFEPETDPDSDPDSE